MIPESDKKFLKQKIMPALGIKRVYIDYKETDYKWPDCWVELNRKIPIITVTNEWTRQDTDNRRSRLIHEAFHIKGLQHGIINGKNYSTYPKKDEFSKSVYRKIK